MRVYERKEKDRSPVKAAVDLASSDQEENHLTAGIVALYIQGGSTGRGIQEVGERTGR